LKYDGKINDPGLISFRGKRKGDYDKREKGKRREER
jgi:hypothetical protein